MLQQFQTTRLQKLARNNLNNIGVPQDESERSNFFARQLFTLIVEDANYNSEEESVYELSQKM